MVRSPETVDRYKITAEKMVKQKKKLPKKLKIGNFLTIRFN